jgi:protease II
MKIAQTVFHEKQKKWILAVYQTTEIDIMLLIFSNHQETRLSVCRPQYTEALETALQDAPSRTKDERCKVSMSF